MTVAVRSWTRADLPAIQRLLLATWLDAYIVTETAPFVMGSTSVDHYIGYLSLPLPQQA